jgi:hypothetical protein
MKDKKIDLLNNDIESFKRNIKDLEKDNVYWKNKYANG